MDDYYKYVASTALECGFGVPGFRVITEPGDYNCRALEVGRGCGYMNIEPLRAWRALKFLFIGPLILALLFVINLMTSPHHWWIQWPALGIGIAWVINFFRVVRAALLVGGLAAAVALFRRRS